MYYLCGSGGSPYDIYRGRVASTWLFGISGYPLIFKWPFSSRCGHRRNLRWAPDFLLHNKPGRRMEICICADANFTGRGRRHTMQKRSTSKFPPPPFRSICGPFRRFAIHESSHAHLLERGRGFFFIDSIYHDHVAIAINIVSSLLRRLQNRSGSWYNECAVWEGG